MNPLPMILADLRSLRWTGLVVVVLVAVAVAVGIALGAQERAFRHATTQAADDFPVLIAAPGSPAQIVLSAVYLRLDAPALVDGEVLARLSADPRLAGVAPIAFGDVVRGHPVIGTTAAFAARWGRLAATEGRLFAAEGEAVIGSEAKLAVGETIVPSHGHAGGGWPHDIARATAEEAAHAHAGVTYRIVGRLAPTGGPWDRAVLVPVESVWETHGLGNGHREEGRIGPPFDAEKVPGTPVIVAKPKSFAEAYRLRADERKAGGLALFPAEVLVELHQLLGDVERILLVASALDDALVFLAVTALLVTLTQLRRRRYAVLRAMGAPRRFILATVWGVAATLVAIGTLAGVALGWGAARVVASVVAGETGLALPVSLAASDLVWAGAVFLAGSCFALVPALVAVHDRIVDGLVG